MRVLGLTLGIFLFTGGVVTLPTPVPFGAVLLSLGATLILANSRRAARLLRAARLRYPRLDARLIDLSARLPRRFSAALNRSDPGQTYTDQ